MGTKTKKGIFKPLRYISQIFDNKEPDMQIGFPTDVKHVAHIGWDGPNVNSPSWTKDYHSAPLNPSPSFGADGRENPTTNSWSSQEFARGGGIEDAPVRQSPARSRLSSAAESTPDSPDLVPTSAKPRHSRRHQSDGSLPGDSPGRDSPEGSRRSRKPRKKEAASDSPVHDLPAIPKQSNRRKTKGGGSVRSSKSKASTSSAQDAATEESSAEPVVHVGDGDESNSGREGLLN